MEPERPINPEHNLKFDSQIQVRFRLMRLTGAFFRNLDIALNLNGISLLHLFNNTAITYLLPFMKGREFCCVPVTMFRFLILKKFSVEGQALCCVFFRHERVEKDDQRCTRMSRILQGCHTFATSICTKNVVQYRGWHQTPVSLWKC